MHKQRDILPEGLREIVALAEDRFPGDIKKQHEWLQQMSEYLREAQTACRSAGVVVGVV